MPESLFQEAKMGILEEAENNMGGGVDYAAALS
jgi:hypothetical protein